MPKPSIPNGWAPRDYQLPLWNYLENGGTRAAAVWHRRAGKDSLALNWTAVAAHQRRGLYWHMLPELAQARKVIWDGIDRHGRRMIDQAFPPSLRAGEPDKRDMKIPLKCGSMWQAVGSDNYNSLIGANPVGLIFSEWSVADPRAWDYARPILAENGGWVIFIFTMRGRNHGSKLYEMAKGNPKWFAQILTVDDTQAIGPEVIEEERRSGMSEDMIAQEYYCRAGAAIVGSYYGKQLLAAEDHGRVGKVEYDPSYAVDTLWSLGRGDTNAIWFRQKIGNDIRFIDYYEATGEDFSHFARVLQERKYIYGRHIGPAEIGINRKTSAKAFNIDLKQAPDLPIEDGIESSRNILARCWFDEKKCERGVDALKQYRKEWDEKLKAFKANPVRDWATPAAESFAVGAIARDVREPPKLNLRRPREPLPYADAPRLGWMAN